MPPPPFFFWGARTGASPKKKGRSFPALADGSQGGEDFAAWRAGRRTPVLFRRFVSFLRTWWSAEPQRAFLTAVERGLERSIFQGVQHYISLRRGISEIKNWASRGDGGRGERQERIAAGTGSRKGAKTQRRRQIQGGVGKRRRGHWGCARLALQEAAYWCLILHEFLVLCLPRRRFETAVCRHDATRAAVGPVA